MSWFSQSKDSPASHFLKNTRKLQKDAKQPQTRVEGPARDAESLCSYVGVVGDSLHVSAQGHCLIIRAYPVLTSSFLFNCFCSSLLLFLFPFLFFSFSIFSFNVAFAVCNRMCDITHKQNTNFLSLRTCKIEMKAQFNPTLRSILSTTGVWYCSVGC